MKTAVFKTIFLAMMQKVASIFEKKRISRGFIVKTTLSSVYDHPSTMINLLCEQGVVFTLSC